MASTTESSSVTSDSSKKSLVSFAFSGTPTITSQKLNGKNYLDWHAAVDVWFLGQGLFDHLTKKAEDIPADERDQWKRADYQLVSLLWQSIDSKLLVHYRTYKTCHDIWEKARSVYSNDVQRLYDSVHNLTNLQMTDHDLPSYLNKAQSTIEEIKLILTGDNLQSMLDKLDNLYMVFVLHGLHRDFESVRNQILTNAAVPKVEDLINRLMRVPSPTTTFGSSSQAISDSSAFISHSNNRGGRGCGYGGRGGRGTGNRPQCTHCKRLGHTQDRCYFLHGFPDESANVTQSLAPKTAKKDEFWGANQNSLSDQEYKEYLQLKAAQQPSSSATIAHTGNSTACLSHSLSAGSWILVLPIT